MDSFLAVVLYAIKCDMLHNAGAMFSAAPGIQIFGPVFFVQLSAVHTISLES